MRSPNKYTSLKNLLQLVANNYQNQYGVEYSKEEVDAMILQRKIKQSEVANADAFRSKKFWDTRRPSRERHGDVTPAEIVRAAIITKGLK